MADDNNRYNTPGLLNICSGINITCRRYRYLSKYLNQNKERKNDSEEFRR